MKTLAFYSLIIFMLLSVLSCSKSVNPVLGNFDGENKNSIISENATRADSDLSKYRGVFGAWKVHIDTESLETEIIPARNAAKIGDIFDADLSQFLTISPCNNCMRITSVQFDGRAINMTLGIKHPFANITTRPDLHGFDVRAIFLVNSLTLSFPDIKVMIPDGTEEDASIIPSFALMNADGYTSHFDDIVTDTRYFLNGTDVPGNLNPFLRFFDDPRTDPFDPDAPAGHNVMPVGSGFQEREAVIAVSEGYPVYEFYIVADVAYGQSAVLANRTNPQYYLPAFNRTEPWRVEYWIENNNLSYTDPASTADVVVQVFDWQQNATVDPEYPNPSNPTGIPESSSVVGVMLSIPQLQAASVIATTPESGDGSPQNPLTYRLPVTNENSWNTMAYGLLAVRDELRGQASPHGRMPIPISPAGFPYATEDILDYTLYQWIIVNIPYPSGYMDFNRELKIDYRKLFTTLSQKSFAPEFFMDPSGRKFTYQWDYDYDGVTFDVDATDYPSPSISFVNPGLHNIGLRVITNSVPPREYTYTLPVYRDGEVFRSVTSPMTSPAEISSMNRSCAVAMSSDRYYVAYVSEISGQRDVWLAITDGSGTYTNVNITQSISGSFYYPSIQVVEDGVHDGVYVAFNRYLTANWDLYSTFGNLDGSGFTGSNIVPIATSSDLELYADLVYHYNKLFAYYWRIAVPDIGDIWIANSTDFGLSWNVYGEVDAEASIKANPSAVYSSFSARTYVVYEDYRNYSTTGVDLYMAESYGGLDFEPSINLSRIPGNIHEIFPEVASYSNELSIAYLTNAEGSDERHVWLKVLNFSNDAIFDYRIIYDNMDTYDTVSPPSIAACVPGMVTLAFTSFDKTSHDITAVIDDIIFGDSILSVREDQLYHSVIGNIDRAIFDDYYPGPGVVSREIYDGEGAESLIAWTTFEYGIAENPIPIQQYFGKVDTMNVISDAN